MKENGKRTLPRLKIGELVRVQDPKTKRWDEKAEVKQRCKYERSYVVLCESGREIRRNRLYLKPIKMAEEGHEKGLKRKQTTKTNTVSNKTAGEVEQVGSSLSRSSNKSNSNCIRRSERIRSRLLQDQQQPQQQSSRQQPIGFISFF